MTSAPWLIANLDAETEHASRLCPGPVPRLSARVLALISHLGSLMRVFADAPARLWTPAPIDPRQLPAVAGVPALTFVSGRRPAEFTDALWWSSTGEPAARASDRRRCQALAENLGVTLAGSAVVTSIDELERAIANLADRLGPGEELAWVLKAPLSASGRERVRRRGPLADDGHRVRAERLLAVYGGAVFEPWKQRLIDAGCTGRIDAAGGVTLATPHVTINDAGGVFRGIATGAATAGALTAPELAELAHVALAVGQALARDGFRGPFGVDAFAYLGRDGERCFHPLCEINARHTFGHVAQRLAELRGAPVELRLGAEDPGESEPLLLPTATLPGAWLRTTSQLEAEAEAAPRAGFRAG